jgi:hypothetical protein
MSGPKKPGRKRGSPRRTLALSELGVMLDGPGPFDSARVLADIPVRPDGRPADKTTLIPKAKHPKKRPKR